MDRFEALENFVRVVEAGSISGAAERRQVAKSAVSRRLTELEQHLGVQLFRRTTRRMDLTDTGRSLYERAVRLLADLQETELAVSSEHGALSGSLRVAAPLSFGLLHLTPAVNDFIRMHPEIRFDLDFNDRQVDILQESFDVAVRIAELPDSSLIARPIAPIRSVLAASPAYLDAHGSPASPQELALHRCLLYTHLPDPGLWRYRDPQGHPGEVRVSAALQANNGDFLHRAAVDGHGIVLQPLFICYRAIEAGQLVPLLIDHEWQGVHAYAVYPQTRHLSQRVRAFVDFLVERFAGEPYWEHCLKA
ncbi:LysR family transcriptional regulator [Thiohalobacter sp. COW1]|uniref:Transcriptional regulator n=1 Tax=Thiohalobacter thiocyanaticus TaxID=585455 RepID=A0A1Z4VTH1_9GAMM|nr:MULTISPECIES: LysR family transcriptional regulator [Thiohalobacter]BAZ94775.1 transcriptional regulator [Thiohalobacter thiocyanaticus]BCO30157.1 LysR family transcriptional regulator [Thiohalobacter sp. COW1]